MLQLRGHILPFLQELGPYGHELDSYDNTDRWRTLTNEVTKVRAPQKTFL